MAAVLRRYAAFLDETLPKIVAALHRIRMNRTVAGDVEHGANLVERLIIEPAFTPRTSHRVAIGGGSLGPYKICPHS